MALFIDDGYTRSKRLPARPGLHPAVDVVFRPALQAARIEYGTKARGEPKVVDAAEVAFLEKYLVSLNGEPVPKDKLGRLHPLVRVDVLDLILSYTAAEAGDDEGNSAGG